MGTTQEGSRLGLERWTGGKKRQEKRYRGQNIRRDMGRGKTGNRTRLKSRLHSNLNTRDEQGKAVIKSRRVMRE